MLVPYFDRLEMIDYLMRIKGTGRPSQLGRRLRLFCRRLFEYISLMKLMGAEKRFCKVRGCYYYKVNGGFNFKFMSEAE